MWTVLKSTFFSLPLSYFIYLFILSFYYSTILSNQSMWERYGPTLQSHIPSMFIMTFFCHGCNTLPHLFDQPRYKMYIHTSMATIHIASTSNNFLSFYFFLFKYISQYLSLSFPTPLKYFFFYKIQVSYPPSHFLQNSNTIPTKKQQDGRWEMK
jgi:hypothetical protein